MGDGVLAGCACWQPVPGQLPGVVLSPPYPSLSPFSGSSLNPFPLSSPPIYPASFCWGLPTHTALSLSLSLAHSPSLFSVCLWLSASLWSLILSGTNDVYYIPVPLINTSAAVQWVSWITTHRTSQDIMSTEVYHTSFFFLCTLSTFLSISQFNFEGQLKKNVHSFLWYKSTIPSLI